MIQIDVQQQLTVIDSVVASSKKIRLQYDTLRTLNAHLSLWLERLTIS